MNYNKEIFNELKNIALEGKLIEIWERDKGTMEDYFQCDSFVQAAIEMRQTLTKSNFRLKEIMKLYEKISVSDYFSLSPHSDSDFGVVKHLKREKKLRKTNYFI